VGRKSQRRNRAGIVEAKRLLTARKVPETRGPVTAGSGEKLAVGRKSDVVEPEKMRHVGVIQQVGMMKPVKGLAARDVPDDGEVLAGCGDPGAVGGEGEVQPLTFREHAATFAASGQIPQADLPALVDRRDEVAVRTERDILDRRQITLAEGQATDLLGAVDLQVPRVAVLAGGRQEPPRGIEGEPGDATAKVEASDLLAVLDAQERHLPFVAASGQHLAVRPKRQWP
jgi:hypothetical protein